MLMIDGVSKVFMLKHENGSMHFSGFGSQRELVEQVAYYADSNLDPSPRGRIEWLESLKVVIDGHILNIKQDYELDGHKAPDHSGESDE